MMTLADLHERFKEPESNHPGLSDDSRKRLDKLKNNHKVMTPADSQKRLMQA